MRALVLCIVLTACGGKAEDSTTVSGTQPTPPPVQCDKNPEACR